MSGLRVKVKFELISIGNPLSPVEEVFEVEIATHAYLSYKHHLFVVAMRSGVAYALDITGVQFGPGWPLLKEWSAYRAERVLRVLGCWPLGTQRRLGEFGRKRWWMR